MAINNSLFDEEQIQKAKEDFQRVKYDTAQQQFVEDSAQILSEALNINLLAVKGFILRAVKKWQNDYQTSVSELATRPPSDRLAAINDIIKKFKESLIRILKDPKEEDQLNNAIKIAMTTYLKKYAGRT